MRAVIAACLALLLLDGAAHGAEGRASDSVAPAADVRADAGKVLVMVRMTPPHFRPDAGYGDGYRSRSAREARRRIAVEIARAYGLDIEADWPMPELGVECYVMRLPQAASADTVVDQISRDPRAAWAQPMQTFKALAYDDPLFPLQPTAERWHLQALHAASTGRGVIVAAVDSGVDTSQPDLQGQIGAFANFVATPYVGEEHGTAIAGIIVARANNRLGIVGIAPEATLLALRGCLTVAPHRTECTSFSLARALQAAIERKARVVNLSIGGPPDRLLRELLDVALARGIIVVAAADAHDALRFPASHPGVVSVSATQSPAVARYFAPGVDVPTTLPGGHWGFVSGSSYAAAEVSGLLALVLQLQPQAGPREIERFLDAERPSTAGEDRHAADMIDACRIIARVTAPPACICDCAGAIAADEPSAR